MSLTAQVMALCGRRQWKAFARTAVGRVIAASDSPISFSSLLISVLILSQNLRSSGRTVVCLISSLPATCKPERPQGNMPPTLVALSNILMHIKSHATHCTVISLRTAAAPSSAAALHCRTARHASICAHSWHTCTRSMPSRCVFVVRDEGTGHQNYSVEHREQHTCIMIWASLSHRQNFVYDRRTAGGTLLSSGSSSPESGLPTTQQICCKRPAESNAACDRHIQHPQQNEGQLPTSSCIRSPGTKSRHN